jgi:hypothetical protein
MHRIYPGPTTDNILNFPAALAALKRWLLWRGGDRVDQTTGEVKLNKVPVNPHDLTNADTTDPLTWGTLDECIAALPLALEEWEIENPDAYRGGGIGFVFTEQDNLVGFDLDNCVDPVTGEIEQWARDIVDTLDSYTEITPSGTGLHVIVQGTLPPKGRRKGAIEMYSTQRFFTMTGWRLVDAPVGVFSRQAEIDRVWCGVFGATVGQPVWLRDTSGNTTNPVPYVLAAIQDAPDGTPYAMFGETQTGWPLTQCIPAPAFAAQTAPIILEDSAIIAKASVAANNDKLLSLVNGHWADRYPSQSEADMALCYMLAFWTQDATQLDRLFRGTKLMRPKWDEKRGALTYGEMTVKEALARVTEHYTASAAAGYIAPTYGPAPSGSNGTKASGASSYTTSGNGTNGATLSVTVATPAQWGFAFDPTLGVDARDLMRMKRVPPRFLVDGLIPDGMVILAAPAKSYKSYFSLSLALATIGECDWCDTFPVNDNGNVVFFGLESPLMQLRNRLHQLRPTFVAERSPHALTFFTGMQALPTFRNGLRETVERVIEYYAPRLIVIDPLSYLYRLGRQDDLASATLDLLWPLAEVAASAGVTIFAPEHMRKRSKEDVSVVDQLAGSHIKAAIVHGLLMLHREGEDIIIETTMRDAASQELALTLTFDADALCMRWDFKGSAATLGTKRLDTVKALVLGELKLRRHPMRVRDLIANLKLPDTEATKANLRQILRRADRDRDVAMSQSGEYYWIGQ